jgi:NCAIR mutase (PurE)-related protein
MRRFIEAVTVAEVALPLTLAALATMPVATDPASAQGGCKAFGTGRLWSPMNSKTEPCAKKYPSQLQ